MSETGISLEKNGSWNLTSKYSRRRRGNFLESTLRQAVGEMKNLKNDNLTFCPVSEADQFDRHEVTSVKIMNIIHVTIELYKAEPFLAK
jgi:cytoplasmic iron level regulating protein YaaA (DUF328/UPF0246 family)